MDKMKKLLADFGEVIAACAAIVIAVFAVPPILYYWQQWVEYWK
jgi:hypothetical protein